jgi:hypothetical protein
MAQEGGLGRHGGRLCGTVEFDGRWGARGHGVSIGEGMDWRCKVQDGGLGVRC